MVIKGTLNLHEVQSIIEDGCKIEIDEKVRKRVEESFSFLTSFAKDKVIYGINTGFGPMAQWRIDDKNLKELQYNIIRSHSVGVGEPLSVRCVRAAMLSRLMTFLQAHSGVNIQTCDLLVDFLNCGIYPVIPQHGSVGASGDLVQLAHIALALIGEGEVFYKGSRRNTEDVLSELNIVPLQMYTREGLAVTNGTAVMTGIGLVNLLNAKRLLTWSLKASVLMNEIASSYDDLMSEVLNGVKCHPGQQIVAAKMREIAKGTDIRTCVGRIDKCGKSVD